MIFLATALGADVALAQREPCFTTAEACAVAVVVGEAGLPAAGAPLTLEARAGGRKGVAVEVQEAAPGRFHAVVPAGSTLYARVGQGPVVALGSPELVAPAEPALADLPGVDTPVGVSVVKRFAIRRPIDPARLLVATSEGRIASTTVVGDTLVVEVEPGPERAPRHVLVGVLDLTEPYAAVAWGTVRLRARQSADLSVEPGSTVSVVIGSRTYGPYTADARGNAHIEFDVLPGELMATVNTRDPVGNTQSVQTPLTGAVQAPLAVLTWPLPEQAGVGVWARAVRADGRTPDDRRPTCVGPDGPMDLRWDGRGGWAGVWRPGDVAAAPSDIGVECGLGLTSARSRTRLQAGPADHIVLRAYPDALAADFPLSQIQAWVEDRHGERVGAEGLQLGAERGEVVVTREALGLRADYAGSAAVAAGGDVLHATWVSPAGSGPAWLLDAEAAVTGAELDVAVRARDHAGKPIPGVVVSLGDGVSAVDRVSDGRGVVRARLPWSGENLPVLTVRAQGLFLRVPVHSRQGALPPADAPDLTAELALPIRSGRVRRIVMYVEPRPFVPGSADSGRVTVQLMDAAGQPVKGEAAHLEVDAGHIEDVVVGTDGTVSAVWVPPPRLAEGTVRFSATSGLTNATTDLPVLPRPVRGSVGLDLGWMANFASVSSPVVSLSTTVAVPGLPDLLAIRGGVSAWGAWQDVDDPTQPTDIRVRAQMLGIDLGPAVVARRGRQVFGAGVSLALVPYALSVDYAGANGLAGGRLASPGPLLHAGAGYRLLNAELYAEVRYLLAAATGGAVAFDGGVGGLSTSLGYRLLF